MRGRRGIGAGGKTNGNTEGGRIGRKKEWMMTGSVWCLLASHARLATVGTAPPGYTTPMATLNIQSLTLIFMFW